MSRYTFLFKENVTDDWGCVRYINLDMLRENHLCCDGKFNVCGPCYWRSLKESDAAYENLTTVLTEKEYKALCNPDGSNLTNIVEKLESEENRKLFEQVQQEEAEYLMNEYGLEESDVEQIFDEYPGNFRDRGIVGCIFKDAYDCGYEEAFSLGYIRNDEEDIVSKYFDFEKFGEDLISEEGYMQLDDGRVVCLSL